MDRRDVLKLSLAGGAVLLAERLVGADEVAPRVSKLKVSFYSGSLNGGPATNWLMTLNAVAARVLGQAYDTTAVGTSAPGFAVAGRLAGKNVTGTLYDIGDALQTTPLGTLTGQVKGSIMSGTFLLQGGGSGAFRVTLIKANSSAMRAIAGTYKGQVVDAQNQLQYKATAAVSNQGSWQLSSITGSDSQPRPGTVSGFFILASSVGGPRVSPRELEPLEGLLFCLREVCCADPKVKDAPNTAKVTHLTTGRTAGLQINLPGGQAYFAGGAKS